MKKVLYVLCLFILTAGFSCRNSSKKTGGIIFPGADSAVVETVILSTEEIAEISRSITSSVEIANLLLSREIPFSKTYISPAINPGNQITEFDKALALGFLGADLGYLNIYEKTSTSSDVLPSIGKLADELGVGQFFDKETITRFSSDKNNFDSLIFLSIDSYSRIERYLKEENRAHLSALMIIGVWIEGQYLATRVVKQSPDKILKDRIGEQKLILNDLIMLASPYCDRSPEFRELCNDLREINDSYRDIKITYTKADPDSIVKNGALVITQAERSEVEMTAGQLDRIILTTGRIRNKLILND